MTTYLGKSCSFCLPRVPFVNCRQFMYLVISLLVLRAGYGIWLYQFLIIAYLFTLNVKTVTNVTTATYVKNKNAKCKNSTSYVKNVTNVEKKKSHKCKIPAVTNVKRKKSHKCKIQKTINVKNWMVGFYLNVTGTWTVFRTHCPIMKEFFLPWFIAINAWCWRADCEVLIHDGEVGVNW